MKIAAIAAEYDPFHNGHAYHVAQTRAAGATHIVAIMSGNFTQRGTPAYAEKRARVRSALAGGVDLLLELPLPYAMAAAQRFALGVASMAQGMGCVWALSFGSESGDLYSLSAAAAAVDDPAVRAQLAAPLAEGQTFAKARQTAVAACCGSAVADVLANPNDALAVEYIRQLTLLQSGITPIAIMRKGARHDEPAACGQSASASLLRARMRTGGTDAAQAYLPEACLAAMRQSAAEALLPCDEQRLQAAMLAVLRRMTPKQIAALPDISEGLENRVYNAIRRGTAVPEILALAKSKRYTAARLRRVLTAAFLGLPDAPGRQGAPYLRVMGFNERGRAVLARMKETAALPFSDSLAVLRRQNERCAAFAALEARATDLYTLGLPTVRPCGFDFTAQSVRV